jgi:hypothetical protein
MNSRSEMITPGGRRTVRIQPMTVVLSGTLYPSSTAAMHHDNHLLGRQS